FELCQAQPVFLKENPQPPNELHPKRDHGAQRRIPHFYCKEANVKQPVNLHIPSDQSLQALLSAPRRFRILQNPPWPQSEITTVLILNICSIT
ncbi:MAG: hypothetical protein PHS30_03120, partial [Bacteroidales bacterium]|nr:hypothetical protein [Bacteroidales bacterium]